MKPSSIVPAGSCAMNQYAIAIVAVNTADETNSTQRRSSRRLRRLAVLESYSGRAERIGGSAWKLCSGGGEVVAHSSV